MKSSFGKNLTLSLFGESHGSAIGIVIDGLAAGIPLDLDLIRHQLDLRRPQGKISTARSEADEFELVSGYWNGHTTGTPLTILIPNRSQKSRDYAKTKDLLRPSHADFVAFEKYHGFQDYRGGGHFSGRLTAPIVAAGAICLQLLRAKGVQLGSHILELNGIADQPFSSAQTELAAELDRVNDEYFAVLDPAQGELMQKRIEAAAADRDSVGGILETAVCNLPIGWGEPFFNSVESVLAHLLFAVPGVKGVEFGVGFGFAELTGSQANDSFRYDSANERIVTATNHNGGINGGITNGMPLVFKTVIKPTPSIYREQETVDYATKSETTLSIEGRHDPAIIHRARVVIDSMTAIALTELAIEAAGSEWFLK